MWSSIKQEIRSTNVEIRHKLEVQNPKDKNHRLGFRASKFEFVSDFEFWLRLRRAVVNYGKAKTQ
ncbi:MAG: hypothetical protein A2Z34_10670 [Planctomycetes bacterium RBG_16_59_8]|nr:MAG: hypothetical protein A2Z34_10670 [Planctomycetes bacterium RBG_16_59_8]